MVKIQEKTGVPRMKTIKISDQTHANLTVMVGQLTAETGIIKTYEDAIKALLQGSVVLPLELLREIEDFTEKNQQFGYTTKEEFLRESARWLMNRLSREHKSEAEASQEMNDMEQPEPKSLIEDAVNGGEQPRLS